ncbi:MAG: hypothetical protein OHK0017_09740 [Patescibacteria group bacterium]
MADNFGPQGYDYGNYSGYPGYQYSSEINSRVNGLEIIVIIIALIATLISFIWGFNVANAENHDKQKQSDIGQVIEALDYFYANNKAYPIRQCSEDLNPIDYEYFLRRNLTGKVSRIGTENYITTAEFPKDLSGKYVTKAEDYQYNIPCPSVIQESVKSTGNIYADSSKACNFSRSNAGGRTVMLNCYLYTSSVTGDSYQLGYFSESRKSFIIVSKYRTNNLEVTNKPV